MDSQTAIDTTATVIDTTPAPIVPPRVIITPAAPLPSTGIAAGQGSNLHRAAAEWASRPADQRFWTLADLRKDAARHRDGAIESVIRYDSIRVEPTAGSNLQIRGAQNVPARLTNWSFSQLCSRVGAPAAYLSKQTPDRAADCLNADITRERPTDSTKLLLYKNGDLSVRALTGPDYGRIFDLDIIDRIASLPGNWKTPPARVPAGYTGEVRAATIADCLQYASHSSLGIQPGEQIAASGLYRSDRDLFIFQVDDSRTIDTGTGRLLSRGFFAWNSEVGDKSYGVCRFLFDAVCGNHIVWGASQVCEIRLRHSKHVNARADRELIAELRRYADRSEGEDRAVIQSAIVKMIAPTKTEVLDLLFGKSIATKGQLTAAYETAEKNPDAYGPPQSVWGMVNGLTEISQAAPNTAARVQLDRAAGKVLQMAF